MSYALHTLATAWISLEGGPTLASTSPLPHRIPLWKQKQWISKLLHFGDSKYSILTQRVLCLKEYDPLVLVSHEGALNYVSIVLHGVQRQTWATWFV